MRSPALIVLALSFALAGCYSRTVEERQPVVVQQPQPQSQNTVIVPPGSTVVCAPGTAC